MRERPTYLMFRKMGSDLLVAVGRFGAAVFVLLVFVGLLTVIDGGCK
jgi:hypothetical protein